LVFKFWREARWVMGSISVTVCIKFGLATTDYGLGEKDGLRSEYTKWTTSNNLYLCEQNTSLCLERPKIKTMFATKSLFQNLSVVPSNRELTKHTLIVTFRIDSKIDYKSL